MHKTPPHFFHRDAFEFMRNLRSFVAEARLRAALQLFCAQRRNVDKQESALDRRRGLGGDCRRAGFFYN